MVKRITHIFAGFIIVMCLVLAYFMAFTQLMQEEIKGTKRTIFVVILLAYAIYRGFRLKNDIEQSKLEDDEDDQ